MAWVTTPSETSPVRLPCYVHYQHGMGVQIPCVPSVHVLCSVHVASSTGHRGALVRRPRPRPLGTFRGQAPLRHPRLHPHRRRPRGLPDRSRRAVLRGTVPTGAPLPDRLVDGRRHSAPLHCQAASTGMPCPHATVRSSPATAPPSCRATARRSVPSSDHRGLLSPRHRAPLHCHGSTARMVIVHARMATHPSQDPPH